ncbi:MAG TPA: HAMP domain-containing sensor histidine kinase [Parvibaculum sp.]
MPFCKRASREAEAQPDDSIEGELDASFADSVFPVAMYIAGFYVVISILHLTSLPPAIGFTMAGCAILGALGALAAGFSVRLNFLTLSRSYWAGFALMLIALVNSAAHMWLTADIKQSTNFALIFAGTGLFFLSRRWLALIFLITFATWTPIALLVATGSEVSHFAIMNVQAMAFGILAQVLRRHALLRLIAARAEVKLRENKLAEALAQAQLYAVAQQENKAKTEFLSNMSHELRTPLNAILGFTEIMAREMYGPLGNQKYKEYTAHVIGAGQHLLSLVNDILDISRIQLNAKDLVVQPVDMKQTCENCISLLQERAGRGGIRLSFRYPQTMPEIETDARRLKQILINLLSNAVKFTLPGGFVELEIAEPSENDLLTIFVRDSGIGMSASDLENAAKPFWQAESGLNRSFEGTGLGLALVNELLGVMGGTMTLESEVAKGTLATVTLPRRLAVAKSAPAAA